MRGPAGRGGRIAIRSALGAARAGGGAERGLVCLSGCARSEPAPATRTRQRASRGRSAPTASSSAPAAVRAGRRRRVSSATSRSTSGSRPWQRGRPRAPPRRTLLQDVLVAIRCRTSLEGCEPERRGNRESYLQAPEEMLDRFSFDRDAARRSAELRRAARVRPHRRARVPLPGLLRRRGAAIRRLAAICHAALEERYPPCNRLLQATRATAWRTS